MGAFDFWMFLAGLGLFLFGMKELESALAKLGGNAMRNFLRRSTATTGRGILTGIFSTAVLQSSSVVTLMLLAFVGAGILTFQQAIGVVLGANLGTTVTRWLVAFFGFSFKIQAFALPMIALGALGQVFLSSKPKWHESARLLTGFGLMFFGLDFMKTSIDDLSAQVDLSQYADYSNLVFVGIGLVFTALVQSSSATMVIALSALNAGIIVFPTAGSLIIGANLGTTVTILLGSMGGGTEIKRKVAFTHLLFNLLTAIVAYPLLGLLSWLIIDLWEVENPLYALTAFHTIFNGLGILVFLPLIKPIAKWLNMRVHDKPHVITRFIHRLPAVEHTSGITALGNELKHLTEGVYRLIGSSLFIKEIPIQSGLEPQEKSIWQRDRPVLSLYEDIKGIEMDMLHFYAQLQQQNLPTEETLKLDRYMSALRNISYAAKAVKDIQHNIEAVRQTNNPKATHFFRLVLQTESSMLDQVQATLSMPDDEVILVQLNAARDLSKNFYQSFMKDMYQAIAKAEVNEKEMSDLIRINRELYNANKFLMRGVMALMVQSGELYEAQMDEGAMV
jgi:phosphate:Na+ symporter